MTQPTPKLPAPLAFSGTIVAQMSAVQTTLNAVIAYLAAQPAGPDLGPLQKAVADLEGKLAAQPAMPDLSPLRDAVARLDNRLSTESKARSDQYDAVMRECRKILDLPPVQFPDLAGLQKATAANTDAVAELRRCLEGHRESEFGGAPDTALLEARIAQLEAALGLTAPVSATPLPDDLPGLAALKEDGRYTTLEAVAAATDEELDAVTGIGPATVQAIRQYSAPETEVTNNE